MTLTRSPPRTCWLTAPGSYDDPGPGGTQGLSLAWAALRGVADLGEHPTIKEAVRFGQRPTTELVDAYNIGCKPIRDLLVRYFDERRPNPDCS